MKAPIIAGTVFGEAATMSGWRFDQAPKAYGSAYRYDDTVGPSAVWVTFRRSTAGWLLYEGISERPLAPENLPESWQEIVLRRGTPGEYVAEIEAAGYTVRLMTDAEVEDQAEDDW